MKTMILTLALLISMNVVAQAPTYTKVENSKKVKVTWYYDNGSVKETGYFVGDNKEGVWQHFNENGKKTSEVTYVNGVKDGNASVWNDQGVMLYNMVYENGKRIIATQWDENGNLIAGVQNK